MIVCALYDQKTECFSSPFVAESPSQALLIVRSSLPERPTVLMKDQVIAQIGSWLPSDPCHPLSVYEGPSTIGAVIDLYPEDKQ